MTPMHELFDLPPGHAEKFSKMLEKNKGKLGVLVHPFFHEESSLKFEKPVQKQVPAYQKALKRLLKSSLPLVVFEEQHKLQSTYTKLKKLEPDKPVIFISTLPSTSMLAEKTGDWKKVQRALHRLGARSIYVAGEFHNPQSHGNLFHMRCVDFVKDGLRNESLFKRIHVLPRMVVRRRL